MNLTIKYLKYKKHPEDRGGCSIINGKRTYGRVLIKPQKNKRKKVVKIKVKSHKTKISFWASYCSLEFEDKLLEKLYKDLLEIEDKIGEVRSKFLKDFTKYKNKESTKLKFRKKKYKK